MKHLRSHPVSIGLIILLLAVLAGCTSLSDRFRMYTFDPTSGYIGTRENIQMRAKAGDPHAQYTLANRYYHGLGVARNHALARSWMSKSARQGYRPAQVALQGMMGVSRRRDRRQPYYPQPVHVREGYHLTGGNSPAKHKDRDAQWLQKQSPNAYTIEVSRGKRASVARDLHNVPKNGRQAQFKSNGGDDYRGVMGSYSSRAAAEAALKKLPESVRQKARLRTFGEMQAVPPVNKPAVTIQPTE